MLQQTIKAVRAAHAKQRLDLTADTLTAAVGLAEKAGCPVLEELLR